MSADHIAAEGARSRPPHERGSLVPSPAVSMVSIGAEDHHDPPPNIAGSRPGTSAGGPRAGCHGRRTTSPICLNLSFRHTQPNNAEIARCPSCWTSSVWHRRRRRLLVCVAQKVAKRSLLGARRSAYPAGPAGILHRPDPIMIVAEPSFVVELAYIKFPF
jgi:hypothetical protein